MHVVFNAHTDRVSWIQVGIKAYRGVLVGASLCLFDSTKNSLSRHLFWPTGIHHNPPPLPPTTPPPGPFREARGAGLVAELTVTQ